MSSSRRPWYKWYPKDFVTDEKVQSLSAISELVYRRLLDIMWQSSACVLLNDCLRLANTAAKGLPLESFKKAWDEIQTPGFELFKITEDGKWIYSKRLQEQLQEVEIKAKAGKKGGKESAKQKASKRQAESKQKSTILDTDTDTDNNTPYSPPQGGATKYSESFETWWKSYPNKTGKEAAYRSWKKIGKSKKATAKELMDAITMQVAAGHFKGHNGSDFIPNPATWLNQGRWLDEIKQPAPCSTTHKKEFCLEDEIVTEQGSSISVATPYD